MDGRDHVRRAIRHYLERDEDLSENPEDPSRLNRSIRAAFTLARAAVAAGRDLRDAVLRLPSEEPGRPSRHHRHYEAVWGFLSALWELIDYAELEQEVASSDVEDPVWFFGRALDQHLGGNPFEALAVLSEGDLAEQARDPWVLMLKADALAASGDQTAAIAAWEEATAVDPALTTAHVAVAGELEARGRDREALAHWLAVRKAVPPGDPVAGEAKRHIVRLRQRLLRDEPTGVAQGHERLPRWGPSWVPAWPGRGQPREEPAPGPADLTTTEATAAGGDPAEHLGAGDQAVPPGSDPRRGRGDPRVAVIGGDPVSEGATRTRSAVYLAGGRLVGPRSGDPADLVREEPDLIILTAGINPETCGTLAEMVRDERLRARDDRPVAFCYNGPPDLRGDLEAIFDGIPLTFLPDIAPSTGPDIATADTVEEVLRSAVAAPETVAFNGTVEAVGKWLAGAADSHPAAGVRRSLRGAVARGAQGLAPVLGWLDRGELRPAEAHSVHELVAVVAEPRGIESVAVRIGRVHGHTFAPDGQERAGLLERLFQEMPQILPGGEAALLMDRLFSEGGPGPVAGGTEAFAAASLIGGAMREASLALRQSVTADVLYGIRSSHLVVGGSLISRLPGPEYALLAAVDGCQPSGVTRVLLDPYGIMASLGEGLLAGRLNPDDPSWADGTASLLAGCCICVAPLVHAVKWGKPGRQRIMDVSVRGAWREGERKFQLCRGELRWIPLPAGRRVELVARPESPYNVGRGRGVEWRGDFVAGGLGLLLDGRGRPLRLPTEETMRTTLQAAWASELVGGNAPPAAAG